MARRRDLVTPKKRPPPMQFLEALMSGDTSPTGRRALVLPVLPGLRPGLEVYEKVVFPLRDPNIDVYGFTIPFGPVPEDTLYVYGDLLDFVVQDRQVVEDEGTIRTRAWLDTVASAYDRIVLFSYQPALTLRPWTRAIPWSAASNKTRIVRMTRSQRITDPVVTNQFRSALGLPKQAPDQVGLWAPDGSPRFELRDGKWFQQEQDDAFDPGSPFEDAFDEPLPGSDTDILGVDASDDDSDVLSSDQDVLLGYHDAVVGTRQGAWSSDAESVGGGDVSFDDDPDRQDILGAIGRAVPGPRSDAAGSKGRDR